MANDTTKVLRYIFRADADAAKKALKDFDGATKSAEATLGSASRKMSSDLARVEASAKRAASAQKGLGQGLAGGLGGGARNVAEAALQGSVSPLSTVQSSLLAQFGGAEKILSGVSTKALVATGAVVGLGAAAGYAGKLSVDAFTNFADKVDAVQDVVGGTAEQASALVNVAAQWGVSSETLAASEAKLAQNIANHRDQLTQLGVQVAVTKDGNTDLIATTANVADAYNATSDPVQKAAIAQAAYGKAWVGMVDVLEKGGDAIRRAGESAKNGPTMSDQDLATAKEFKKQSAEIRQQFEAAGVDVGRLLVPALTAGLHVSEQVVETIRGLISVNFGLLSGLLGALSHLPGVGGKFDEARDAIDGARDSMNRAIPPAEDTSDAFAGVGEQASISAGKVQTLSSAMSGIQSAYVELHFSQNNAIETQDKYADSLSAFDDISAKAADSVGAVGQATDRSARQIADAEKAIADANQGVADAVVERTKAVEDANRRMIDVEERAAKRIVDAQNRIVDARERADRSLRDAARRLEDARQAANDAQVNSLKEDDPYKAQRAREEAVKDLTRAEQDYRDSQSDAVKNVADAEKDLADASTESAKDRADAQRQYADAVEAADKRVVDAQDRVRDATDRMARVIDDSATAMENAGGKAGGHAVKLSDLDGASNTLVTNTAALVASMIARGASWTDINLVIDGAKAKLQGVEQQFGYTGYAADTYTGQLGNIPKDIFSIIHLTLDAYAYKVALADAAKTFTDTMTQSYVSLGVVDVPGGSYNLPQYNRDSGGPLPAGSSIVHNLSGQTEWVYTAEQMRNMGGRSENHFHIAGSVVDAKGLAGVIAQLRRQGFNFGDN